LAETKPKRTRRAPKKTEKPEAPRPQPVSAPVVIAPRISIPSPAPVSVPIVPPVGAPSSIPFPAPSGILPGSIPSSFGAVVVPPEEKEEDEVKEPVAASVGVPPPSYRKTQDELIKDAYQNLSQIGITPSFSRSAKNKANTQAAIDQLREHRYIELADQIQRTLRLEPGQKKGKMGTY